LGWEKGLVPRQGHQGSRGFTLVEVMAVTTITGLLATAAIPVIARSLAWWQMQTAAWQLVVDIRNWWQMQTAAWQLVVDIRKVQMMAMSGEDYHRTILFDTVNHLYRVRKDTVIIQETKLPAGVTFAGVAFPYNQLSFNLEGVPAASGDIILRDRYGRCYYITVLPVTGRVKAGEST